MLASMETFFIHSREHFFPSTKWRRRLKFHLLKFCFPFFYEMSSTCWGYTSDRISVLTDLLREMVRKEKSIRQIFRYFVTVLHFVHANTLAFKLSLLFVEKLGNSGPINDARSRYRSTVCLNYLLSILLLDLRFLAQFLSPISSLKSIYLFVLGVLKLIIPSKFLLFVFNALTESQHIYLVAWWDTLLQTCDTSTIGKVHSWVKSLRKRKLTGSFTHCKIHQHKRTRHEVKFWVEN